MQVVQLFQRFIYPVDEEYKKYVFAEVEKSATFSFDFFLLVVLSCSIATLGLVSNSAAVIIGAMLVAPLMSPIIGIGMASISGDARLARKAAVALLYGAILAVSLSCLMTLINTKLPFVVLQELPSEVLARTRPSPIDLVIALAGGLAAAYALTRPNISAALPGVAIATALMPPLCTVGIGIALFRWDVAGGASLLFITNAITIAFASAIVFFLRGFAFDAHCVNNHVPSTLLVSALITLVLLVPLTYYSVQFVRTANENRIINEAVFAEVAKMDAELVDIKALRTDTGLDMVITLRTTSPLHYEEVLGLQEGIVDKLALPVSLKVNQVFAERLDPLIPPTPTFTFTPGPSPTVTLSPTITSTFTPSPTATATPTPSPTNSPTPLFGQALNTTLPRLQLYQNPGGPVIGAIRPGQTLTILYGRQQLNGLVWAQVVDQEGRLGWIPELYIKIITTTPAP